MFGYPLTPADSIILAFAIFRNFSCGDGALPGRHIELLYFGDESLPGGKGAIVAPSGEQITISAGDQQAVVVEVGDGLRSYSAGGRELVDVDPTR